MSDKYGDKYRVHNWVKFDYSEIGEYIGENYTDKPLRNDEIVDLLNEQGNEIQRCKLAYTQLASYVDANFDEYMTQKKLNERIKELEIENEQLKKDRFICLDCKYCGYTEIGCLCEKQDHWEKFKNKCNDFKELKY